MVLIDNLKFEKITLSTALSEEAIIFAKLTDDDAPDLVEDKLQNIELDCQGDENPFYMDCCIKETGKQLKGEIVEFEHRSLFHPHKMRELYGSRLFLKFRLGTIGIYNQTYLGKKNWGKSGKPEIRYLIKFDKKYTSKSMSFLPLSTYDRLGKREWNLLYTLVNYQGSEIGVPRDVCNANTFADSYQSSHIAGIAGSLRRRLAGTGYTVFSISNGKYYTLHKE